MNAIMRYIEVEFRPGGRRYAYGYDGDAPLEASVDRVEIDTKDGRFTFRVLGVGEQAPNLGGRELRHVACVLPREA